MHDTDDQVDGAANRMKRILFVDDEQRVLDGLRRSLSRQRSRWSMAFVDGGEAALEAFAEQPFDVIVTDMRMPGMDGATLLCEIKERYPDTVRIVLSGHSEHEAALKSVSTAHQFLSKPCEAAKLQEVVERSCNLQQLFADAALKKAIGKTDSLPSLPTTFAELRQRLDDPEVSIAEVAEVIERDMAICAKVMQIVNSSFFGLPQNISDIQKAVSYLGTRTIQDITLSVEVFRPFATSGEGAKSFFEGLQKHAYLTALLARKLVDHPNQGDDAFMAGLLHDIGKLILASQSPEDFEQVLDAMLSRGVSMDQVEREILGTGHAEVGAYLLGIWGLPNTVVEAVAHSHHPGQVHHESFEVLSAVHVADFLSHSLMNGETGSERGVDPTLDVDYLGRLGVAERLPEWQALAAEVLEASGDES